MGLLPKDLEILPPHDNRVFKKIITVPEAIPTLLYVTSEVVKRPVLAVLVCNAVYRVVGMSILAKAK